jgi:hypothetical protein
MSMIQFQYEIFVNGIYADSKPTCNGALALVALRFFGNPRVEIIRHGSVVWRSQDSIAKLPGNGYTSNTRGTK